MPSLADIAGTGETVDIRGLKFEVRGIGAADIATMLAKFPALRAAWTNRPTTAEDWFKAVPELVPMLIAAGCGKINDDAEIEAASRLSIEDQASLLAPIWKLTMPSGLGPFVNRLTALFGPIPAAAVSAPGARSKAPGTRLPRRSKA